MSAELAWLDVFNTSLTLLLFLIGLLCLLTQRNAIKQVIGLKIMLQGVTLGLIHAGHLHRDVRFAETMVISALIVETVVIAIGLALIVNVFRCYPSGDVDRLTRLRG
jgi:NADH:ubiquinone oxidoreductase subunit K